MFQTAEQWAQFVSLVFLGCVLSLVYKVLSYVFKKRWLADMLFGVTTFFLLFFGFLHIAQGQLRWFQWLGVVLGFFACHKTLGGYVDKVFEKFYNLIARRQSNEKK